MPASPFESLENVLRARDRQPAPHDGLKPPGWEDFASGRVPVSTSVKHLMGMISSSYQTGAPWWRAPSLVGPPASGKTTILLHAGFLLQAQGKGPVNYVRIGPELDATCLMAFKGLGGVLLVDDAHRNPAFVQMLILSKPIARVAFAARPLDPFAQGPFAGLYNSIVNRGDLSPQPDSLDSVIDAFSRRELEPEVAPIIRAALEKTDRDFFSISWAMKMLRERRERGLPITPGLVRHQTLMRIRTWLRTDLPRLTGCGRAGDVLWSVSLFSQAELGVRKEFLASDAALAAKVTEIDRLVRSAELVDEGDYLRTRHPRIADLYFQAALRDEDARAWTLNASDGPSQAGQFFVRYLKAHPGELPALVLALGTRGDYRSLRGIVRDPEVLSNAMERLRFDVDPAQAVLMMWHLFVMGLTEFAVFEPALASTAVKACLRATRGSDRQIRLQSVSAAAYLLPLLPSDDWPEVLGEVLAAVADLSASEGREVAQYLDTEDRRFKGGLTDLLAEAALERLRSNQFSDELCGLMFLSRVGTRVPPAVLRPFLDRRIAEFLDEESERRNALYPVVRELIANLPDSEMAYLADLVMNRVGDFEDYGIWKIALGRISALAASIPDDLRQTLVDAILKRVETSSSPKERTDFVAGPFLASVFPFMNATERAAVLDEVLRLAHHNSAWVRAEAIDCLECLSGPLDSNQRVQVIGRLVELAADPEPTTYDRDYWPQSKAVDALARFLRKPEASEADAVLLRLVHVIESKVAHPAHRQVALFRQLTRSTTTPVRNEAILKFVYLVEGPDRQLRDDALEALGALATLTPDDMLRRAAERALVAVEEEKGPPFSSAFGYLARTASRLSASQMTRFARALKVIIGWGDRELRNRALTTIAADARFLPEAEAREIGRILQGQLLGGRPQLAETGVSALIALRQALGDEASPFLGIRLVEWYVVESGWFASDARAEEFLNSALAIDGARHDSLVRWLVEACYHNDARTRGRAGRALAAISSAPPRRLVEEAERALSFMGRFDEPENRVLALASLSRLLGEERARERQDVLTQLEAEAAASIDEVKNPRQYGPMDFAKVLQAALPVLPSAAITRVASLVIQLTQSPRRVIRDRGWSIVEDYGTYLPPDAANHFAEELLVLFASGKIHTTGSPARGLGALYSQVGAELKEEILQVLIALMGDDGSHHRHHAGAALFLIRAKLEEKDRPRVYQALRAAGYDP